ncbi:probable G-protein coupled receptor Mth-like 1 [Schistocerca nitens]|uniref:probable G-protein coupled receptor Mth-like 1 n=1 Tax=Schistocerca nitens TaxID=7011 RepID=UPI0021172D43|nr:probable G-protein coupled receptor Mth-like 1 [Schistocerca nitens]
MSVSAALSLPLLLLLLPPLSAGADHVVRINRCCAPQERYSFSQGACEPAPGGAQPPPWTPLVYSPAAGDLLPELPPHWQQRAGFVPRCEGAAKVLRTHPDGLHDYIIFDNGSLWLTETQEFFHPEAYCVDGDVAVICLQGAAEEDEVRFRKCCLGDGVFSEASMSCTEGGGAPAGATVAEVVARSWPRARLTANFPVCRTPGTHFEVAGSVLGGDGSLKRDGSLIIRGAALTLTLRADEFCLERVVQHSADAGVQVLACPETVSARRSRVVSHVSGGDVRFSLYPAGLCVSALFLTATLCAGSLLPAASHALHWRCQTCYVACLLVGDVLLAATQMSDAWGRGLLCFLVAIAMHFFFLAAFFWLNTMCINIWWTFRDLRPTSMDKRQEVCRLRLFRLYAWGGPLLIMSVAAIVDLVPADDSILRPKFGEKRCWFYGDSEIFYYFYAPIGVLLLVNVILFGATAHELTCGLWKREVVKSTTERATLWRVCVKLVVVMGLTWVIDILSWAIGGPAYLWYVTDLANALQGVFIFGVVGCQPQVWAAINRMWCLREQQDRTTAAHRHLSSYSQGLPSLGDSSINSPSTKNTSSPMETVC